MYLSKTTLQSLRQSKSHIRTDPTSKTTFTIVKPQFIRPVSAFKYNIFRYRAYTCSFCHDTKRTKRSRKIKLAIRSDSNLSNAALKSKL
jgi:glutaredoxin